MRVAVAVAVASVACRGRPAAPPPVGSDARATIAAAIDASDDRTVRIPDETTELVTVVTPAWDATTAQVRRWRRDPGGAWRADGPAWPAVIGHAGLAWGRGVHGDGPPVGRDGPRKREGDGASPAGIFAIGRAFGVATAPPAGARVAYTATATDWRCVDDPRSAFYTQILDERTVVPDWRSAEIMRRADGLYDWVLEVRHNPAAVDAGGSCIFFHLWSGPGDQTVGCTAMAESALRALIAALDPTRRPVVVQLPVAEYEALAVPWHLPPR